jgi:hypothetical protein
MYMKKIDEQQPVIASEAVADIGLALTTHRFSFTNSQLL